MIRDQGFETITGAGKPIERGFYNASFRNVLKSVLNSHKKSRIIQTSEARKTLSYDSQGFCPVVSGIIEKQSHGVLFRNRDLRHGISF